MGMSKTGLHSCQYSELTSGYFQKTLEGDAIIFLTLKESFWSGIGVKDVQRDQIAKYYFPFQNIDEHMLYTH